MNYRKLIVGFSLGVASVANAATVFTVSGDDEATITTAIGAVSTTDLAAGVTTKRDFGGGNFNAAATTDGAFGSGFQNNAGNGAGLHRYQIDLGSLQLIGTVNTYSGTGNDAFRGGQEFTLYGSASAAATPGFDETDATTWTAIDSVFFENGDGTTTPNPTYGGSSISDINQSYRHLMWVADEISTRGTGEATVFKEFDVLAPIPEPSSTALLGLGALGLIARRRRG